MSPGGIFAIAPGEFHLFSIGPTHNPEARGKLSSMRYTIKWRLLLKLAIVLILAGVAIHLVHRWQVRSQVGAFLHQADLAHAAAEAEEKNGNLKAANAERDREQSFLQRYILARPTDTDVRERLARLMCETAVTRRQKLNAFFVLEDILRRDPARDELRRFTIEYAMKLPEGLSKEAKDHLNVLFMQDKNKRDGELVGWYAKCLAVERNYQEAEKQYLISADPIAVDIGTIQVGSYAQLAVIQRLLNKPDDANGSIHTMLDERPEDPRAYLLATAYLRDFGLVELPEAKTKPREQPRPARSAESLINEAYKLAPNDLEVLIAKALFVRHQARKLSRDLKSEIRASAEPKIQEARTLLAKAIQLHPRSENAYLESASFESEFSQVTDALKVVRLGLDKNPESVELMHGLLELQFKAGDAKGAAETLKELQARGIQPGVEEFESARVRILEERWKDAADALEKAIPQLHDKSALARQAHLLLGRCYAQMGENERRLRAFQLALPDEVGTQLWGSAMLGIAEAEAALGRADDALKTYRTMADWFPAMWVPVVRLELLRALRSESKSPDWTPVDGALARANEAAENPRFIPDSTDLRILEATVQYHKGHPKARDLLENLRAENPKNVTVRTELAMYDIREKRYSEALTTLDTAAKELGDQWEIRLARGRVLSAMKVADLSANLIELATRPNSFSIEDKRRLLRGLAEIASTSGADDAATKLWDELAAARPFDLGVHLIRFDRALRAGNTEAMRLILPRINEHDGENGRSARLARAILLIHESRKPNSRELRDQALNLLNALEREQLGSPSSQVCFGQGLIHDLNGNHDIAKAKYRQAVERDGLHVQATTRLFEMLSASNDPEERKEAETLLDKLQNTRDLGPDLERIAAGVSLRADNIEGALRHAAKAVKEDSQKYQDQIWLGHVYWRSKKTDKLPEPRFRRATVLAPEVMETWLTLIQYLMSTDRKAEAAECFDHAIAKVKTSDISLFKALGHAQLGDTDKAIAAFKDAREGAAGDVRILMAEAEYLRRIGRLPEARAGFQRVLALATATNDEKTLARQRLALAMAADPDYAISRQALELIGGTPVASETPAQRRSRAVILGLQKDRPSKLAAIQLLEENQKGSNAGERFLLAQLHNTVGNRTNVLLVMEELLLSPSNRIPLYLRFYARWLLRERDLAKAAMWISELEKVDPAGLATAELKARLAAARMDLRGAGEVLRAKADGPNAPIATIAAICEDIGLHEDAERLLRRLVDQNKQTQPRVILALAAFHGRRGRTSEGLRICDEMRGKLPLSIVGPVAVGVLYNAPSPSAVQMEQVAVWIDAELQKAGSERAALLQILAAVRNLQAKYEDAANLYKEVLKQNSKDILALNNLAYLLSAAEKNHTEALALIEQAKRVKGPHTILLDTEALIWLNANQYEKALPLMETVVAEAPSGSAYFHLAQVEHKRVPGSIEARAAWRRAQELGLKPGDLHPLERKDYEEISVQLGQ